MDNLFRAYFIEGKDIGNTDVLAQIAADTGMDEDVTKRLLNSDADSDDIKARDQDARHKGVQSVPTFVIANQHVVPGAQSIELWQQVIDDVKSLMASDQAQ